MTQQGKLSECPGCQRVMLCFTRGLCGTCYKIPDVRERHAMVKDCRARNSDLDFYGAATTPKKPARVSLPGTWQRVAVMRDRVSRRESVNHPDDAKRNLD